MQKNNSIYFPGLNGIRAFAALMVVFAHTSNRLDFFNLKQLFSEDIATYAVTVFFTLSGFLITYLLLAEKKQTGTIDIKKFYMRRVLRIWPLYYTYLLITVIVSGFEINWAILFYILILPNLRNSFKGLFNISPGSSVFSSMIGHYWSLGVEEQFYSFWPWVIKKSKKILHILILLPLAFLIIKLALRLFNAPYGIITFFNYTRFGCMAIGALGAFIYFNYPNKLNFFKNRIIEVATYIFFVLIFFNKFHLTSLIDHEIVSFFTLSLIYNQIANKKALLSLENRVMDFLGKISFGMYVYHPLIIYLLSLLIANLFITQPILKTIIVFTLVLIFTIMISYLSYEYFEKRFLRIKTKYTTVKSSASKEEFNTN